MATRTVFQTLSVSEPYTGLAECSTVLRSLALLIVLFLYSVPGTRATPKTVHIHCRSCKSSKHRCLHAKRFNRNPHSGSWFAFSEQGVGERDDTGFQEPLPVYCQLQSQQDLHVYR